MQTCVNEYTQSSEKLKGNTWCHGHNHCRVGGMSRKAMKFDLFPLFNSGRIHWGLGCSVSKVQKYTGKNWRESCSVSKVQKYTGKNWPESCSVSKVQKYTGKIGESSVFKVEKELSSQGESPVLLFSFKMHNNESTRVISCL